MIQKVEREVWIQDMQRFQGNNYFLEINLLDDSEEPTLFIYKKQGEFLEGVAWHFPKDIEYLQNPKAVDVLAQEIIDDSDPGGNERDSEMIDEEWVDASNAEFVYQLSRDELALLQEFMYKSFGVIPYQAFAQYYPTRTTIIQLPLPGFEEYHATLEKEYPHSDAVEIEQKIINCLRLVRSKVDEDNKGFMEALQYLQSEEVGEFGKNYGEYHTLESKLPSTSIDLIKSYFA